MNPGSLWRKLLCLIGLHKWSGKIYRYTGHPRYKYVDLEKCEHCPTARKVGHVK